jgi:hypothetical protein
MGDALLREGAVQLPSEITSARPQRKHPCVQAEVHKHNAVQVKNVWSQHIAKCETFGGITGTCPGRDQKFDCT